MNAGHAIGLSDEASAAVRRALQPAAALLGAAVLVYAVALVWSGPQTTWKAAGRLGTGVLCGGAAVVALSLALRCVRWAWLLRGLGHHLPWVTHLRIYLAGLALTSTPGKTGEALRSVFLLQQGVGLRHSLAAFFADRLSDVIGMSLLGALAGAWWGQRSVALEALAVATAAGSFGLRAAVRHPGWSRRLARLKRAGRAGRGLAAALGCLEAWAAIWHPGRMAGCTAIAGLAYGLQALVFAHFVAVVAQPLPVAQCVAIFVSSTLIGAASMVPAGLGVMEAALVLQLTEAGASAGAALAAALLTRLATFWFGLALGAVALLSLGLRPDNGAAGSRPS